MARITVTESGEYEVVPFGRYPIQVVDIKEVPNKFAGPGDPPNQYEWVLEIIDGAYNGIQLKAWSSQSGSTKSKLVQWATALGLGICPGFEFDTDDLIGLQGYAKVDVMKSKPSPEFPEPREFSKVIGIEPFEPVPAPAPTRPAPARPAATRPAPAQTRQPVGAGARGAGPAANGSDPFASEA